jgi:D-alanine-D-alanine ligase
MTKRNIAVVVGGDSSEYVVSMNSGANVMKSIDRERFTPWMVKMRNGVWEVIDGEEKIADVDKSDFSFTFNGKRIRFEYAYIIIHGAPGENGILQGYFELVGVPYSSSDTGSSALTFNKFYCNNFLRTAGVEMARSFHLVKGDKFDTDSILSELGLPVFVKPNAGGSSFGITKVKTADELKPAIEKAFSEDDEVLVDEFIAGTEFTCGLVKIGNRKLVFPATEIIPKNEFFNYESKYVAGMAEEITPARISDEAMLEIQSLSSRIYDLCGCNGIVRIDFIRRDGRFYFLEVNTIPGMTGTSFIPQQVEAMGLDLKGLLTEIIENGIQAARG